MITLSPMTVLPQMIEFQMTVFFPITHLQLIQEFSMILAYPILVSLPIIVHPLKETS